MCTPSAPAFLSGLGRGGSSVQGQSLLSSPLCFLGAPAASLSPSLSGPAPRLQTHPGLSSSVKQGPLAPERPPCQSHFLKQKASSRSLRSSWLCFCLSHSPLKALRSNDISTGLIFAKPMNTRRLLARALGTLVMLLFAARGTLLRGPRHASLPLGAATWTTQPGGRGQGIPSWAAVSACTRRLTSAALTDRPLRPPCAA